MRSVGVVCVCVECLCGCSVCMECLCSVVGIVECVCRVCVHSGNRNDTYQSVENGNMGLYLDPLINGGRRWVLLNTPDISD